MFLLIFDILYLILSNLLHPIRPNTSHKLLWVYLLPPCTMQPFRSKLEVNGQCYTCDRAFDQPSTYNKHKWTCSKTKRRLSSALELAREKWLRTNAKQQQVELAEPLFNPEHCIPGLAHVQEIAKVCNNSQILVTYWLNQPNIQHQSTWTVLMTHTFQWWNVSHGLNSSTDTTPYVTGTHPHSHSTLPQMDPNKPNICLNQILTWSLLFPLTLGHTFVVFSEPT